MLWLYTSINFLSDMSHSLASVNFLVFCTGATQCVRVLLYQQSLKGDSISAEAEKAAKEEGSTLKSIAKDPEAAVEKAKV